MAFKPQPKDDADAEAPLLLTATALTTGVVVAATFVTNCAVVVFTAVTTFCVATVPLTTCTF
jgi:hypothetical protein